MSLVFGPFRVIPSERLLLRFGQPVPLPSRAYEVLLALLERSGEIVSKSELIERVSGGLHMGESQLRVHISRLRKALRDGRKGLRYVENVNGHGYRFIAPVMRTEEYSHAHTACSAASFEFGPFELIPDRRLLLRAGNPVNVPSRAWEILLALIERAGDVVGKAELLARVWPRVVVEEAALRVHIFELRRILGDRRDGSRWIESVTGLGYRFVASVRKRVWRSVNGTQRCVARLELLERIRARRLQHVADEQRLVGESAHQLERVGASARSEQ